MQLVSIADNCAKTGWNSVPDTIICFVLKNKYLLTVQLPLPYLPSQHQNRQLLLVMCAKMESGQLPIICAKLASGQTIVIGHVCQSSIRKIIVFVPGYHMTEN